NLKKSWHPSTLRNIERVWKAEQKHEVEKQKIEQLQKELAEERAREEIQQFAEDQGVVKKKDERLDWMYQGPAAMVNREEYLLGRKIDKTFETILQTEKGEPSKDDGSSDVATMFSSQNLSGTATVDLANKIREDPLFNIMKKEKEERKNLLTNPIKMKQLQQLLKASLSEKKSKKSKKNKKKKHQESDSENEKDQQKRKKHKKSAVSESDEERPSSMQMKDHYKHKMSEKDVYLSERKRSNYASEEFLSSERGHKHSRSSPFYEESNPYSSRESNHYSTKESSRYSSKESNHYSSKKSSNYSSKESNHYSSKESTHYSSKESNHYSSKESDRYSSKESDRYSSKKSSSHNREYKNDTYDSRNYMHGKDHSVKEEKKKKLNNEERERLLREMQENAVWRDEQRKRNTQRYKEEEKREDAQRIDTSDFLKPMLSKAAVKGSLENRIKQKIFSIQRSSRDMDKNFARRD
ncbi:pre-mRNA-splicing factor CWC25 homolog, partial [Trichonephila clavata]